jgi:type II secretory pathway pseudopilin PulG
MVKSSRQLSRHLGRSRRPAFTLVEIIVVLLVVTIGLVGILSLIIQNIQSQNYDKDNLIANHLAQEGIELIRKVRDSNWKTSQPFYTNIATVNGASHNYYMDYLDTVPLPHSASPDIILKQDSNGFYLDAYRTGTSTIFSRQISTKLLNAYSLQIDSVVTWGDHGHNYTYDLQAILYDWHQ